MSVMSHSTEPWSFKSPDVGDYILGKCPNAGHLCNCTGACRPVRVPSQPDLLDAIAEAEAAQSEHDDRAMAAASDWRRTRDWALFLDTLYADHLAHGYISQNRVRVALSNEHGLVINPAAYSGMWPRARKGKKTGIDRHPPLIEFHGHERCTTSRSGNNHKDLPTYRWIGPPRLNP